MKKFNFILLALILLLSSCSSDENEGSPNNNIQVLTNQAQSIQGTSAELNGSVNSDLSNFSMRGICWATVNNPTIELGQFAFDNNSNNGSFSFTANDLNTNTTYYARAFVEYQGDITYGNQISFATTIPVNTNIITNITSVKAVLNGSISQGNNDESYVGFFYSTEPNVTQNDIEIPANFNLIGSDDFQVPLENLNSDTTYYVRSFTSNNGNYDLGNEQEFRTTGYFGPAGGYVAYDKGLESDGWRYMEIYPETLSYDINFTTGSAWGEFGTFISGTVSDFESGLSNTQIVAQNTSQSNCAAKLCLDANINGFDDWFLPSIDELKLLAESVENAGLGVIADYCWSSTQYNADYASALTYDPFNDIYEIFNSYPKSFDNLKVLPVRRY